MTKPPKEKIVIIVGPTASGKTALSIVVAKQFAGEVISADSRQVYRGLDIGTEKVTPDEMAGVPHHLIDVVDIDTVYTTIDYKQAAEAAISDITSRHKLPIIAGGTFFYIDTLLGRISTPEVAPDCELRAELSKKSLAELQAELTQLDPRRYADIDSENPRRLIRAIEIARTIGNVPETKATDCPYEVLKIGIKTDREELRARLRTRAEAALSRGLIEETQKLINSGVAKERLSEIGLEYRLVLKFLDGNLTEADLIQKLEEKNWQYAKRQLLWLSHDSSIEWFEHDDLEGVSSLVKEFIS